MLIRNASIWRGPYDDLRADVRIADGRIAAIGQLAPREGEAVIDAGGGALLPGLHDHHIHLAGAAAALASVPCGPPDVVCEADLATALARPGDGWLRGVGYHESVAGVLTRKQLDLIEPSRPVRIQHRSGRMWFFNSAALDALLSAHDAPNGLDRETGQLFDSDGWLREALGSSPPVLRETGELLARYGVTGVTEISPANGPAEAEWIGHEQAAGHLPQSCVVAGSEALAEAPLPIGITLGPLKLHLHDHALPGLDATVARIRAAHQGSRPVAVHCTTEAELVFTLAALRDAGALRGDRIEHAGMASDELVAQIAELGLAVVANPHFITERGDEYRAAIPAQEWPWLYRLASFVRSGVTLAAGSDAPHGKLDPWQAMAAAVSRRTRQGALIGVEEALTPEQALALYLKHPHDLGSERTVETGAPADLCLLDRPWQEARSILSAQMVRATIRAGELIHQRVDQAPF